MNNNTTTAGWPWCAATLLLLVIFRACYACDVIITVTVPAVSPPPEKADVTGTYVLRDGIDFEQRHSYLNADASPSLYLYYANVSGIPGWIVTTSANGVPSWPAQAYMETIDTNPDAENFDGIWKVHDGTGKHLSNYLDETLAIDCGATITPTEVLTEAPTETITPNDCTLVVTITVPGVGTRSDIAGSYVPDSYDVTYGRYVYKYGSWWLFYGTLNTREGPVSGWIVHNNFDEDDWPFYGGLVVSNDINPPSGQWDIHVSGGANYDTATLDIACEQFTSAPTESPEDECCTLCGNVFPSCNPSLLSLDDSNDSPLNSSPQLSSFSVDLWDPNNHKSRTSIRALFSDVDSSQKHIKIPMKIAEKIGVQPSTRQDQEEEEEVKFLCGVSFTNLAELSATGAPHNNNNNRVNVTDVMYCVTKPEYEDVVFGALPMKYLELCVDPYVRSEVSYCAA